MRLGRKALRRQRGRNVTRRERYGGESHSKLFLACTESLLEGGVIEGGLWTGLDFHIFCEQLTYFHRESDLAVPVPVPVDTCASPPPPSSYRYPQREYPTAARRSPPVPGECITLLIDTYQLCPDSTAQSTLRSPVRRIQTCPPVPTTNARLFYRNCASPPIPVTSSICPAPLHLLPGDHLNLLNPQPPVGGPV